MPNGALPRGIACENSGGTGYSCPKGVGMLDQHRLVEFWDMEPTAREAVLLEGVLETHAWHYERNAAYRAAVSARGVGEKGDAAALSRLLRPTAATFKSYIDVLGTAFPQDDPSGFLKWLATQISAPLEVERRRFKKRYQSLEDLFLAIERQFADMGLRILTSSGTSGRATIMLRDGLSTELTVDAFYQSFQRFFGMKADHVAIFMMPRRTRIAMACMAQFSVSRVGLPAARVHYAIPFPAYPDHVRIRGGRLYRTGVRGVVERRVWHPSINALQTWIVDPLATRTAVRLLRRAAQAGEKVLLFGSPAQLHQVALAASGDAPAPVLGAGSLLGMGGGMKDLYPFSLEEIREDLGRVFRGPDGEGVPVRDVYGMAEANWAAMQCREANYHLPPWVLCATLDGDGAIQKGPRTNGILAFFDPFGGGRLFPAFFKTGDRVELIDGTGATRCGCGETGAYLSRDSIQRADLVGEAGCAGQV